MNGSISGGNAGGDGSSILFTRFVGEKTEARIAGKKTEMAIAPGEFEWIFSEFKLIWLSCEKALQRLSEAIRAPRVCVMSRNMIGKVNCVKVGSLVSNGFLKGRL